LNNLDIFGEVHWGAEWVIWDQFFTFRVDATGGFSAIGWFLGIKASAPDSIGSVFGDSDWMAEVCSEQWSWS
jgi:hypothetical protein